MPRSRSPSPRRAPPARRRPRASTFPVLYEDEALLAIDKPAGVVVHDSPGDEGSANVAGWFRERYPDAAAAFDAERPGIVHRLDKHTSGVLLLAKTPAASAALGAAFEQRRTGKTYLALVEGVPSRPQAVIEADIGRHRGDRRRMAIASEGREARTEYEVVAASAERALLLVRPETGRTHQIRVHLAAIGHPVTGDDLYGKGPGPRQLLHAWRITVPHPAGGGLTVTAPLPADMTAALRDEGLGEAASTYAQPAAPQREEAAA